MATTKKEYRMLIEYRVNYINKKLGTEYQIDYVGHYGGWEMFMYGEGKSHRRGALGFDVRKSNAEMLAYVDGIYELLNHYEVVKSQTI